LTENQPHNNRDVSAGHQTSQLNK